MIYTKMTMTAINIMFAAHKEQRDKSGLPYVFHPWHVAEQMTDELSCTAALLHDVIEDTDITEEYLLSEGIAPEVVEAVKLLTHDKETDYLDYVRNIKPNPIARAVKLADLRHNSDPSRVILNPTERDLKRHEKYKKAIGILESAE
ncbi:MAG: GTP pyrophosphokinase [Ruminococcus sp.]|nr:GTP pyrophosphokinase [Ruminococcus sp.]